MATEAWIETNEAEDVAGSIRHALRCSKFVNEDPQAWKWFMLSLHSALQGACVCHLTTTAAPLGAITESNSKEWIKYFEERRLNKSATPPKTCLMSLPGLLKAVRNPNSTDSHFGGKNIAISDKELNWLRLLHNEIRNQFIHFEPTGWVIEISGLPDFAKLVARIVADILDAGWGFRHMEDNQRDAMRRDLDRILSITT
ncbi:hypothetical protein [Paracoccus sp. SY]|uniref:hypothetical protein n=1 Tax=Paracoccus sp. SY TaxID=1330255 RepID=UPI000CD24A4F|nr:hypothetical protein [Paracoccus sp. SY]